MNKTIEKQLDRLDADLRELFTDIEGYSEAKMNTKPDKDSWSVFQVMHHLILAEGLSMKYVQKKLSFNPELKNAGVANSLRVTSLNTYLKSPIKRKAPEATSEDLPITSQFWDVVKTWKTQREDLRTYLDSLPEEVFKKEVYKHPFAGRLSLSGMLSFFQSHFNRHKKQIYKTIEKVDAVKVK